MGLGTTPARPATPSLCTAGKWALPPTAGEGVIFSRDWPHNQPGPPHTNQPDRGAGELWPWKSAPKVASDTQTARKEKKLRQKVRVLVSSPRLALTSPLSRNYSEGCPGPARKGALLPTCSPLPCSATGPSRLKGEWRRTQATQPSLHSRQKSLGPAQPLPHHL